MPKAKVSKSKPKPKAKAKGVVAPPGVRDLVLPDFARYFFIVAIVAVMLLFFWVISPFFNVLIYSALVSVVFFPIHRRLLIYFRGQRTLSAFFTTLLVLLIVLGPLVLFMIFLTQEAVDAYSKFELYLDELNPDALPLVDLWQAWASRYGFLEQWQAFMERSDINFFDQLQELGQNLSAFLVSQAGIVLKSLGDSFVGLFIFLLTVFFFFRDGDDVVAFLKKMSPLPEKYENKIEEKLRDTTYAVVVGNFGTALAQGVAGGIGFAIAGIDDIFFWVTVMTFAALIPYVGAAIIWGPMVLVLLLQGAPGWSLFLLLWGMFGVSSVDNIVRPILIGGRARMHPLATFLVILGGVLVFGLKGIIFGPLILSLTLTIIHIYELEYSDVLNI